MPGPFFICSVATQFLPYTARRARLQENRDVALTRRADTGPVTHFHERATGTFR